MSEMVQASSEGRLLEAFVTGTAFFVAAVGMIRYKDTDINISCKTEEGNLVAPYTLTLRNWLKDIMYGGESLPGAKCKTRSSEVVGRSSQKS
ncbi:hypothetical protein CEP54_015870 [Fusarium duplospermum]|uniref:Uncharacterized protein n=1 Tax=Fusarium duplospermum TaxID=1325734 RepID=A0A428NKG5_9HYPO|nr:hypothetical protein CEP54_015870 [Fusarium duplospermum]